ncbi:hypothetical protein HY383_04445 [Candidatus Daviesbacteria bacterium]|nr:hypothetical protein [Candidatus Daviesbacteria bacterium]
MEASLQLPTELREALTSSPVLRIEANGYRTREIVPVRTNDKLADWHSLKGEINVEKGPQRHSTDPSFEVLFDPLTQRWLKIAPPHAHHFNTYVHKLQLSSRIGRIALDIAGLPDLANQFEDAKVEIRGRETFGFISPHIGPSLEYLLKTLKSGSSKPTEAKQFLTAVYTQAFWQALRLYLGYGFWTYDPNPGNILIRNGDNKLFIAPIDFSSPGQAKENKFSQVPIIDRRRQYLQKNLDNLYHIFNKQCGINGIPSFSYPAQQIGELIEIQLLS